MPYIPHTDDDISLMLHELEVESTECLFDEIPSNLRYQGFEGIPSGLSEMEMLKEAKILAEQTKNGLCFMGAGSYEHHIPAAVWDIASRGEFLTSYTPYQAEASQGTLQLLYEFQTMIAELTAMDVANSSLYDGASALAEAVLMAVRLKKNYEKTRILVAKTLHPFYRQTLETIVRNQYIELINIPYDSVTGTTDLQALKTYETLEITALVIPQPNFFGCLEPVDWLTDWAAKQDALSIACVNPTSLALLNPPGEWGEKGVDIVCGEGQPLGVPMASGGPYFGFLSTRKEFVRQIPGRLIGCTVDKDGKPGFALTLQAREQHIRRGKATSNICTNQGLLVTAATIYMSLLGPEGLRDVAVQCHQNTVYLLERLSQLPGVKPVFSSPFFHEALLQFEQPLSPIIQQLHAAGIEGGYCIEEHYPELVNTLLVCATEMRTKADIDSYAQILQQILSK